MKMNVGYFDPETGGIKKNNFEETGNCLDCEFHETQPDPDPNDWFRDTNFKVYCRKLGVVVRSGCEGPGDANRPDNCPRIQE